jgi:hypothetical protein
MVCHAFVLEILIHFLDVVLRDLLGSLLIIIIHQLFISYHSLRLLNMQIAAHGSLEAEAIAVVVAFLLESALLLRLLLVLRLIIVVFIVFTHLIRWFACLIVLKEIISLLTGVIHELLILLIKVLGRNYLWYPSIILL